MSGIVPNRSYMLLRQVMINVTQTGEKICYSGRWWYMLLWQVMIHVTWTGDEQKESMKIYNSTKYLMDYENI